jgi:hypothetical protein
MNGVVKWRWWWWCTNLTYINFTKSMTELGDFGRLGSVTGPGIQADRVRDDFHAQSVTGSGVQTDWPGMIFTLDVQTDRARDDFHARRSDWPGSGLFSCPTCDGACRLGRLGSGWARDELGRPPREGMTIEVPNITNAVEVSKFYRGLEMKSIGVWTLAVSTPQCGGGYQRRVTDRRRLYHRFLGLITGIP